MPVPRTPLEARRSPYPRGFTLVEIMVVVLVIGSILLLVPPNLFSFGARSRLENSANTIASAVAGAREQAIIDGVPVGLELGIVKERGRVIHAHRFVLSNRPTQKSDLLDPEGERDDEDVPEEEETLYTPWHRLQNGVMFAGVSEAEDNWFKMREGHPLLVTFSPDGTIDRGFAIRITTDDLDVKTEYKTITIMVNALTTQPSIHDGLAELPPLLEEHEFIK